MLLCLTGGGWGGGDNVGVGSEWEVGQNSIGTGGCNVLFVRGLSLGKRVRRGLKTRWSVVKRMPKIGVG